MAAILIAVGAVLLAHILQVRKQEREAFNAHTQYLDGLCFLMVGTLQQANELIAAQHSLVHAYEEADQAADQVARDRAYENGMRMIHIAHVHADGMVSMLARFNLERVDRQLVLSCFVAADSFMRELRSVLNTTSRTAHLWPRVAPEIVKVCETHGTTVHSEFQKLAKIVKARGKFPPNDTPPGFFRWLRRGAQKVWLTQQIRLKKALVIGILIWPR